MIENDIEFSEYFIQMISDRISVLNLHSIIHSLSWTVVNNLKFYFPRFVSFLRSFLSTTLHKWPLELPVRKRDASGPRLDSNAQKAGSRASWTLSL